MHELLLRNREELIIAKIAKEAAEGQVNTLKSDIMLLRDQIATNQQTKERLVADINLLK